MSYYIVCQKKRNNPRMDIRVCTKKCEIKDVCSEYKSSSKILLQNDSVLQDETGEPVHKKAA